MILLFFSLIKISNWKQGLSCTENLVLAQKCLKDQGRGQNTQEFLDVGESNLSSHVTLLSPFVVTEIADFAAYYLPVGYLLLIPAY
jgi:hypothetical protein